MSTGTGCPGPVLRFGGEADGRSIDYGAHFLGFFRDRSGELGEVWDRKAARTAG